jgi:hypothetical protein
MSEGGVQQSGGESTKFAGESTAYPSSLGSLECIRDYSRECGFGPGSRDDFAFSETLWLSNRW